MLEPLAETSEVDARSRTHPSRTHHRDIASVLTLLGGIADNQQKKTDAKRYYQKALERFRALGDDSGMAAVLHNLASVLNDIGDSGAAVEHYQQSLRRYHGLGNQVGVAYNLYSLGVLYLRERRYGEADASLEQALALCEETGLDALVPNVLQRLGQVAMGRGDTRTAARQLRRALQRSDVLNDDNSYTSILVSLGRLALQRGELGDARQQIVQGLERLQNRPVSSTLLRCLTNVAELWQREKRDDDAARLLGNILAHPLTLPETAERAQTLLATLAPNPDSVNADTTDPDSDDLAEYAHEVFIALATSS
ncbi:MAG: tetratricopeptide repeat protein [Trueperaceae bacterium]|nr:tetratricopeptide repeat protein [Trueperaceae bacterium]